jgi:hypothetical protein
MSFRRISIALACLASATLAFVLGRVTAPERGRFTSLLTFTSAPAVQKPVSPVAPSARRTVTRPTPELSATDPIAAKQAEIITLLTPFKNGTHNNDLGPELLTLISWTNTTDEEGLDLLLGISKAMIPDQTLLYQNLLLPVAFTRWTQLDAPSAFAAYLALPEEDRTNETSKAIFNGWVKQGAPRDAIDHALAYQRTTVDESSSQSRVVGEMLETLMKSDPVEAQNITQEFADSTDPLEKNAAAHAANSILDSLLETGGKSRAMAWIEAWPNSEKRDELRQNLVRILMSSDETNQRAGLELLARISHPDTEIYSDIARQKVRTNVSDAQAWAYAQPGGDFRAAAIDGLVETLIDTEKNAEALKWLASKPADEDHDRAYARLALANANDTETFPAALQLSKRVVDPENARRLQSDLLERWLSVDPRRAAELMVPVMENAINTPAQ